MHKVQIMESKNAKSGENLVGNFGISGISKHSASPLTTLYEHLGEHQTSHGTIINTVEAMQANVEEFSEHVEICNHNFKQQVMEKIAYLKKGDTQILTGRVEEIKVQEGTELAKLNAIYCEKKAKARKME